jgi:hypothetical protein
MHNAILFEDKKVQSLLPTSIEWPNIGLIKTGKPKYFFLLIIIVFKDIHNKTGCEVKINYNAYLQSKRISLFLAGSAQKM